MTLEELIASLNDHQKAYINMNLAGPKNGDYMLACFRLKPGKKLNMLQAACEVAAESSTGTNFLVQTETAYSKLLNALVYKIDQEKELVWIAYPWRLFDRNGNVQNILTYVAGNVF